MSAFGSGKQNKVSQGPRRSTPVFQSFLLCRKRENSEGGPLLNNAQAGLLSGRREGWGDENCHSNFDSKEKTAPALSWGLNSSIGGERKKNS